MTGRLSLSERPAAATIVKTERTFYTYIGNGVAAMAHTLSTHFSKLLQDIQPPEHRLDEAVELPPLVKKYLAGHEEFETKYPHSRQVGSYAQHLSVGDVKDVDFLIRVDVDTTDDSTAREVLKGLKDALDDLPEALGYTGATDFDITRNRRSVHVTFEQEDFHLDVVPCVAPEGFDESIFVPDWGFKKWVPSHPLGVVTLVKDLEAEHPGKFRNLAKLLKHFRNTHMTYMKPKSYWLVALAIDAVSSDRIDTTKPLAVVFDQLLNHLHDEYYPTYCRTDGATPNIKDPMLEHNVSWNWSHNAFEAFMRRLEDGIGWTGRALVTEDKDTAIELWQRVFGDEFPSDVNDYARTLAATGQPGYSHATRAGWVLPGAAAAKSTSVPPTRYYGREEG